MELDEPRLIHVSFHDVLQFSVEMNLTLEGFYPCSLRGWDLRSWLQTKGLRCAILALGAMAILGVRPQVEGAESLIADSPKTADESRVERSPSAVRLSEVLERVLAQNDSLQVQSLGVEIAEKTREAERGIFEPQVVTSVGRDDRRRQNNTQQLLGLGALQNSELMERNTLYHGGLEFLARPGTRLQAGYNLQQLGNNLQRTVGNEYETFVGLSLTQPLLKNYGPHATLVRIRLAAMASDVAFQEFRRHLMLLIAQVESGYWDLYLAQEQERMIGESVALAGKILKDNRERSRAGLSSEVEVLQAEALLVLRQAKRDESRLKIFESAKHLTAFYSDPTIGAGVSLQAIDKPEIAKDFDLSTYNNYQLAYAWNPDHRIRQHQVDQEEIKLKYAKNQRRPQLDLKGSYGLNGLGSSIGASFDEASSANHPSWSLGLELRIPLTGGIRERRELEAAKLNKERAVASLKDADSQIANGLDSGIHRVQTYLDNVESYRAVVTMHQKLLDSQLAQLEVGRIDTRSVLETEGKLVEAKVSVVEGLVFYRKALLELALIRGSLLQAHDVEINKSQLGKTTLAALQRQKQSERDLESTRKLLRQEMQRAQQKPGQPE